MTDQAPQNDPTPPILPYRGPGDQEKPNRSPAIRLGCLSVWALLILAIVIGMVTQGQGFAPTAGFGALLLLALGVARSGPDRHLGFFLGLFFGVLTVVGAALLLLAILCGGFRWR